MTGRPLPRLAIWLVTRGAPVEWQDSIVGDLEEERKRRLAAGQPGGVWWACSAAMRISVSLRATRRGAARPTASRMGRGAMTNGLAADIRHATRALTSHPGYAAAAILTLSLGIGATTAVFNLANWLLLRPLPGVTHGERLVSVRLGLDDGTFGMSVPWVNALSTGASSLSGLAAYLRTPMNVTPAGNGAPRRVAAEVVTGNFFDVLGERFLRGRGFTRIEGVDPGADAVAVISQRYWQEDLGGDSNVIGRSMLVNGRPFTIIGVASRGFHGTSRTSATDLWLPVGQHRLILPAYEADLLTNPQASIFFGLVGRMADGATRTRVASQADAVLASIKGADAKNTRLQRLRFIVVDGPDGDAWVRGRLTASMSLLMGAVVLLLLLTCANVTNLVLGRATGRRTEIATRLALGASRLRVARLLLMETAVLALAASGVAIIVAWVSSRLLEGTTLLRNLPPLDRTDVDWRVAGFALAASGVATMAAGVVPAFSTSRSSVQTALREHDRAHTAARGLMGRSLIVIQVSISLALLIGALLLARSMAMRNAIDPGFDPAQVLAFSIDPQLPGFDKTRQVALYRELLERVRALPGVRAAGASWAQPYGPIANDVEYWAQGRPDVKIDADYNMASAGFFDALGLAFVSGRDFSNDELLGPVTPEAPVIINESAARKLFGAESPTGRRIVLSYPKDEVRTVVGVVRDMRQRQFLQEPEPMLFRPWRYAGWAAIVVGLTAPADVVASEVRQTMAAVEPRLPIYDVITLRAAIDRQLSDDILVTRVTLTFAALAMLVASVGLYSVLARAVAERRREFGIRAALGARPGQVGQLVALQALQLVSIGIFAGLAASFWLSRFVKSRLFGVTSFDPAAMGIAVGLVLALTLVSAIAPALRAGRADPVRDLK